METNVLVTGGLGFIGSHLAHRLLQRENVTVHVVDNLSQTVLPYDEILAAITEGQPGRLKCYIEDVNEFLPEPTIRLHRIYHLASVVGPVAVLGSAGRILNSIVQDTYRMIDLALEHDARLVFVSTSEIYGGGDAGLCSETTPRVFADQTSARQEYAAAKMACEIAIQNMRHLEPIDAISIRPFNVAGVRQHGTGGFVIPRFVGQALLGLPLTVYGDGSQIRAFTDARDVAMGIELACDKAPSGEAYNVGNPANRVTVGELADCVLEVTASTHGKRFVDPKTLHGPTYVEAPDKFPDASRLQGLGWNPTYSIEDIVQSVYRYMSELDEQSVSMIAGLAGTSV